MCKEYVWPVYPFKCTVVCTFTEDLLPILSIPTQNQNNMEVTHYISFPCKILTTDVRLLWLAGHVATPSASQTVLVEAKGATTFTGDGTSAFSNQNVTTDGFLMPQWSIGHAILKTKMSMSIPDNSSKRRTLRPAQCTHVSCTSNNATETIIYKPCSMKQKNFMTWKKLNEPTSELSTYMATTSKAALRPHPVLRPHSHTHTHPHHHHHHQSSSSSSS